MDLEGWISAGAGLVAIVGGLFAAIGWLHRRRTHRHTKARQRDAASEDLTRQFEEITRAERRAYEAIDADLEERGMLHSGMRGALEAAEEHDLKRRRAVAEWKSRLADLGAELGEPPRAGATQPTTFEMVGRHFTRHSRPPDQPIVCGACGRLVYLSNGSWWCPEHEYEVS